MFLRSPALHFQPNHNNEGFIQKFNQVIQAQQDIEEAQLAAQSRLIEDEKQA